MNEAHRVSPKRIKGSFAALALVAACLSACAAPSPQEGMAPLAAPSVPVTQEKLPGFAQTGLASWYGRTKKLLRTASGEKLSDYKLTAAHRSLPMGTIVHVTNLRNGHAVDVRINDRGPFVGGRVIDLSYDAALQLGMTDSGVVPVRLEVFDNSRDVKVGANTITAAK